MRIDAIETIRVEEFPNLLWVQVHTDTGLTGLGETFFAARAVEAYIHEIAAPKLLGEDPLAIEKLHRDLVGYLGFRSSGVEVRGNSAIDIALWDIFGKLTQQPIAQLLGGMSRTRIRTYNTCAGSTYMRGAEGQQTSNYGIDGGAGNRLQHDDLHAFLNHADDLAEELLAEGITAMKIWPFDAAAEQSRGQYISAESLNACLQPLDKIRKRVGDRMDVMVEFHSMWQLVPAMTIARALKDYRPFWLEDPIKMDSLKSLEAYARACEAPICASETLGSMFGFRDLLETGVAGVVMPDVTWCGGISEARKIAALAEAWHLPFAPHDCTGPVALAASTHLALHATNALVQESVRAYYRSWYRDLVTQVPEVDQGYITVPPGPGLGLCLHPELDDRFATHRRVSDLMGCSCSNFY